MSQPRKINRRDYVKYATAGMTVAAAIAGAYYFTRPKAMIHSPAETFTELMAITKTETESFTPNSEELSKVKSIIKTDVKDVIVRFQEDSFWTDYSFLKILESQDEFISKLEEKFISTISSYGKEAVNPRVEVNQERNSSILTSEVHGAISRTENRCYATFEWLIKPMGLDFIDDHFKETNQGLSWEGKIDGVPTEIICEFPYTGSPYKAWAHPTGHCHAHVWWEL